MTHIEAISLVEASKQALEALEDAVLDYSIGKGAVARHTEAITTLRTAIEQAEKQEPVAWYDREDDCAYVAAELGGADMTGLEPLYTTPPAAQRQWVSLTDADKDTTSFAHSGRSGDYIRGYEAGMEAAEDKLREKNGG